MAALLEPDTDRKTTQVRIELSFQIGKSWTEVPDFRKKLTEIFSGSKEQGVCGLEGTVSIRMAGLSSRRGYTIWQDDGPDDVEQTHACRVPWTPISRPKALWKGNYYACVVDLHAILRQKMLRQSIDSERYVSHITLHSSGYS